MNFWVNLYSYPHPLTVASCVSECEHVLFVRWTTGHSEDPDTLAPLWPLVTTGLHDVLRSPWYCEVRMPTKRTQRLHVC